MPEGPYRPDLPTLLVAARGGATSPAGTEGGRRGWAAVGRRKVAASGGADYSQGVGKPKDKAEAKGVPERSRVPLRDLTVRELALPWVNFIMIDDLLQGKVLAKGHGGGVAC